MFFSLQGGIKHQMLTTFIYLFKGEWIIIINNVVVVAEAKIWIFGWRCSSLGRGNHRRVITNQNFRARARWVQPNRNKCNPAFSLNLSLFSSGQLP